MRTQAKILNSHCELVETACQYLLRNYADSISRSEVAAAVGVSDDYLTRIFGKTMGVTPWEYLTHHRIQCAKQLLITSRKNVTWIAGEVGFDDPAYFTRVFHRVVGCTPREYRVAKHEHHSMHATAQGS